MTSKDIYDMGYAVPMYDCRSEVRYWRFREEEYTLPSDAVRLIELPELGFRVGRIEDIRAAKG